MTTDKELAYALVEMGVGRLNEMNGHEYYFIDSHSAYLDPEAFVRDWRVAGACMERGLRETSQSMIHTIGMADLPYWTVLFGDIRTRSEESLPRAVIEAFVEARK